MSLKPLARRCAALRCTAGITGPKFLFQVHRGHSLRGPEGIRKPDPTHALPLPLRPPRPLGWVEPVSTFPRSHPSRLRRQVRGEGVLRGSRRGRGAGVSLWGPSSPARPLSGPQAAAPRNELRLPPAPPGRRRLPARPQPAARPSALKRLRGSRWPKRLPGRAEASHRESATNAPRRRREDRRLR